MDATEDADQTRLMSGISVIVIALVLLLALAVTAPLLGVDTRPIGRTKWGDPPESPGPTRF